jgi:hypothetical protein
MMDRVMLHRMMNDMVTTMMNDTPVVHRMMNLSHRKAGQRQK